jgi:hypothetical protein
MAPMKKQKLIVLNLKIMVKILCHYYGTMKTTYLKLKVA